MTTYTVQELAKMFQTREGTVLEWINSKELPALNCGRAPDKKKPRWRVTQEALDEFMKKRQTTPPPAPQPRRRKKAAEFIEYIK